MIKKVLLSLGLFSLSLISFGYCEQTFLLNYPATLNDGIGTNNFELLDNANFLMNDTYKVFQIKGTRIYPRLNTIFWSNTGLYVIMSCEGGYACQNIHTSILMQGFIQKYCETNYRDSQYGCSSSCSECNDIDNFLSNDIYSNPDSFSIYGYWSQMGIFCFDYENLDKSICFTIDDANSNQYSQAVNSLGFTYNPFLNELTGGNSLMNYITDSPFNGGGGSSSTGYDGTLKIDSSDVISYFEDKGYSQNLCFVGTWDLSSNNYDDFKFSKNGNGEHIFNFFRYAYDLGTGTSYTSLDVEHFLDEIYMNNYTFKEAGFYKSGDLVNLYNFDFNLGYLDWVSIHFNISLYPYSNKSLVYQLYPHQLYYYIPDWRLYYTSTDLVEYCYYKLGFSENSTDEGVNIDNFGNAGELNYTFDSSLKDNVSQWKLIQNNYSSSYHSGNLVVGLDWSGTPLDYFTGEDLSSDFHGDEFILSNFNKFKDKFQINQSDFGVGALPLYIMTFLCAIILFRFLQH